MSTQYCIFRNQIHQNPQHSIIFRNTRGLPMTHSLHIFEALELKFTPSTLSSAWSWPSKFASEGYIHSLKLCAVHQPEKVGMSSVSNLLQLRIRHAQIHNRWTQVPLHSMTVTLIAVLYRQLSYISYIFRHFDLLVLKIIIAAVCQEKKPKIFFF